MKKGISVKVGPLAYSRIRKAAQAQRRSIRNEIEIAIEYHVRKLTAQTPYVPGE